MWQWWKEVVLHRWAAATAAVKDKTKGLSEHTQCPCFQLPQMPHWCVFALYLAPRKCHFVWKASKQHLTPTLLPPLSVMTSGLTCFTYSCAASVFLHVMTCVARWLFLVVRVPSFRASLCWTVLHCVSYGVMSFCVFVDAPPSRSPRMLR